MTLSWIVLSGTFFLGELAIPQFFLFWFGIGSVTALISHFLEVSYPYQWIVFIAVSSVGLLATSRFAKSIQKEEPKKAGFEGLIGEVMVVTKKIDNLRDEGQVKGRGDLWRARSESGKAIKKGVNVKIIRIEGVSLVVKLEDDFNV